jgi:outer membrane protein insertion porin family
VDVAIDIEEGDAARIRQINIIGANAFEEYKLIDRFQLSQGTAWSFITGSDKYSKQKLIGDQEVLRSYYLDRGYIHFEIESTQVSITPDKRDVYITINVKEGEQFRVKDIKMSGELVVQAEELKSLILLKSGDIFSRQKLVQSTNRISDRLGVEGYAFANVNAIPEINNETNEISLTFFVDPGKRVYVRRINITGNTKTRDEVIRRELRQMEGGWISTPLINRSKIRLQRLQYFDDVKIETPAVPGTTDQVDVNVEVTEGSTGNFTAGIGYGQESGFLFNASVTLNNYLGTGKRVSLEVNNSQVNQIYSFSYDNPYWTIDGISRGFTAAYRTTDAAEANLSEYTTDVARGEVNFGIPLSEYTRLRFDVGYEDTDLTLNTVAAPESYKDWLLRSKGIDDINGDNINEFETATFKTFTTSATYSYDSRNRRLFPESGILSRISGKVALPGQDLEYYRLDYRLRLYFPLAEQLTLSLGGDFGYGDGYGDVGTGRDILPFFENFYAGGTRSVRGYKGNTIGPRDKISDCNGAGTEPTRDNQACVGDPVGGNRRILTRAELYFPVPFTEEPSRNFRLSLFTDAGRVSGVGDLIWNDTDWRATYGVAAVWITPVGALTFNWAWPIDEKPGDETERFQFNIGAPF